MKRTILGLLLSGSLAFGGERVKPLAASFWNSIQLTETPAEVARLFPDAPRSVSGRAFRLYQFTDEHMDHSKHRESCDGEFAWSFNYQLPSGRMQSVIRSLAEPVPIDNLIPKKKPVRQPFKDPKGGESLFATWVLDAGRVLIASGVDPKTGKAAELILMRREAVPIFYPWIQIEESNPQPKR